MLNLKAAIGILFMAIGGFGIFMLFLEIAFLLELNNIAILIKNEDVFNDCMNIAR